MQDTHERFAALHSECHDGVYRYLHRRILPAHLAEDLCAETFRIAWECLLSGKQVDTPYLVGIARNLLRNTYRAHGRHRDLESRLVDGQRHPEPPESPLDEVLETLTEDDRELVTLTYWDRFSGEEVARILGCSAADVRVRLHRVRKDLARKLAANMVGGTK